MSILQVVLFGKFRMDRGDRCLTGFEARRAQELFCYLLLYRHRPHLRETLADLLWYATSTSQSKNYLRKALWQVQTTLDAQAHPAGNTLLQVDSEWVQVNPNVEIWLDVQVFEQAFAQVKGVPGNTLDRHQAQILQNAVALYQGHLLEGWYQDWCLCERERFQYMYLTMLDKLMDYCEARNEYESGIVYGMQALRYDRARERTCRRLMRLQYLAGRRTEALRQYERCVTALDEDLAVRPTKRTVTLYDQIRQDQLPNLPFLPTRIDGEVMPSLPEVLDRLQRFHLQLADMQQQMEQDMQTVQQALYGRS